MTHQGRSVAAKKMAGLATLSPVPISMDDNTNEFESSVSGLIASTGSINSENVAASYDGEDTTYNANGDSHRHGQNIGDGSDVSWCSSCRIGEPTIISGTNTGKYTIWNVELDTLRGSSIVIRKRYTDFEELREKLKRRYSYQTNIPQLPPKTYFLTNRFDPVVLEERRKGLEFFLSSVLLNPLLCNTKEVTGFVAKR